MTKTASKTALGTAIMRAAHQLLDDRPLLFEDPVALAILGAQITETIRAHAARYQEPVNRAMRAHVCLRSRYTEDKLAQAAAAGISRYVLVGAGFDTFILRQPDWARTLQIIEVDHPATQAAKREMIDKAGFRVPGNVIFVATDFTRETLGESLARHGIGIDRPAYFSWLGVSMYLEESAIETSLQAMSAFGPGSEVTLTFRQPPGPDPYAAAITAKLAKRVENAGEAFISSFTPAAMEEKLLQCGYTNVVFLEPEKAEELYFTPPRHDLPAPTRTSIVFASRSQQGHAP